MLVVDDNPINREYLRAALGPRVARVSLAEDGAGAIEACRESAPDLVLMDLHMPGMDGEEAWQRICGEGEAPCPVVALTADSRSGERERLLAAGFDGFLNKPVALAGLVSTISEVCGLTLAHPADVEGTNPSGQDARPPVIDRARALASCNDDEPTVDRMQAMMLEAGDRPGARALLHRWRGACGYAGTPGLAAACQNLEIALEHDATAEHLDLLSPGLAYHQLIVSLGLTRQALAASSGRTSR